MKSWKGESKMPKPIPRPSKQKEAPNDILEIKGTPVQFPLVEDVPDETPKIEETPVESQPIEETPKESPAVEFIPEPSKEKTEMPSDLIERNCVVVNDKKVEIKPTKLKYFRNKAASAYNLIKIVPIHEFLTYGKGVLDAERDADQLLYDFLVAAFDNSTFVRDNYDNMDAEQVEQIVRIFGRINHIDEKEELARKNKEAQAQAKH